MSQYWAGHKALGGLLSLTESEMEFLNRLIDKGEIEPSLLTDDPGMVDRILQHPCLQWKALNVRNFRGI